MYLWNSCERKVRANKSASSKTQKASIGKSGAVEAGNRGTVVPLVVNDSPWKYGG
jgi:hypothetical protein